MGGAFAKTMDFLGFRDSAKDEVMEYEGDLDFVDYQDDSSVSDFPAPALVPTPVKKDMRRIVTIHPTTYSEARTIGEAFRKGTPVIINLTNMSDTEARRMVDFAAGLAFGLEGAFERVTSRVFLLSPASVEVDAQGVSGAGTGFFAGR